MRTTELRSVFPAIVNRRPNLLLSGNGTEFRCPTVYSAIVGTGLLHRDNGTPFRFLLLLTGDTIFFNPVTEQSSVVQLSTLALIYILYRVQDEGMSISNYTNQKPVRLSPDSE
jgi:hypothetical protein